MAYGDTKTGQMRLETIIDPQSEEFRKARHMKLSPKPI